MTDLEKIVGVLEAFGCKFDLKVGYEGGGFHTTHVLRQDRRCLIFDNAGEVVEVRVI